MNILNVCDSPDWDLVSYQALHTAARFQKLGHNAAVMCVKNSRLWQECGKLGVNPKPIGLKARLGFYETAGWDVVHFYDPGVLAAACLRKTFPAAKVVISRCRMGSAKAVSRLASLKDWVDLYLGACDSVQEELVTAGIPPDRTFLVPPAIAIGRWESAMLIKPAMFQKRPFKVGTVSMDPTFREQELFLMMAREVLETLPDTNFMLVGLKSERLRAFARSLDISHKVDILWERTDMPEVMAMMHIYAKTSRRAGLSMSVIEAQASGVTCVLPRLRGVSDYTVHERNGLIVPPEDPRECARAVIRLISDPGACRNISSMAFDYVSNNMSVPVVANLLLRLYEDIPRQPGRA